MKAKDQAKPKKKQAARWQPPRGYLAVWVGFLLAAAAVGYVNWQFSSRALPNVFVGSQPVANLATADVRQAVENQAALLKVNFQDGDKQVTVPAKELGVVVDVDATVQNAMLARRSTDIAHNLSWWQRQTVPLVYTNDAGVLKDYIVRNFPKTYIDPQDAGLAFNAGTKLFDVKLGVPGKGFDIKRFQAALPDLASNPRLLVLPVQTVPVEPLIGDKAAAVAQKEANSRLGVSLQFKQGDRVAYTATPADIANWLYFEPDTTAGTLSVEVDKAKVQQFIETAIGGKVTTLPVDRKIVVDKQSGDTRVIQAGSKGYQIKDADKLADDVIASLASHQSLTRELDVTEAPFKTVTMSGYGKWIEVDLSSQTTTLYIGNEPVATYLISSGKAATPTVIGEGRIYAKYPMQTMTGTINGEYYYVPNIKWVSYFYGGEAFHGTYWHHNFGHPMSHGCINMTEDAAKVLYDFAPIGTKVIVHA